MIFLSQVPDLLNSTTTPIAQAYGSQDAAENTILSGSYTGTVAINEPLALGILDISLTLTDTNGVLSGALNHSGTLAFPSAAGLQGSITSSIDGITPTFRIDAAPFTNLVSGRQITRFFRIEGEIHDQGNVLTGVYLETISGFTPQALLVNGKFLASRPHIADAAAAPSPATPTPVTPATATSTPLAPAPLTPTPVTPATATSTPVTSVPGTATPSSRVYLPMVER